MFFSRDSRQQTADEPSQVVRALADFRSRSNSAPTIGQSKITQYIERSSSTESDESEENTEDQLAQATVESTNQAVANLHREQKGRKRKRKNGKKP